MASNSVDKLRSRYVQGGLTDVFKDRLGWWEKFKIIKSVDDILYTVTAATAYRPDLIAYELYKDTRLQWIILQYNNIVDINEELIPGKVLTLPPFNALTSRVLNKTNRGNKITTK